MLMYMQACVYAYMRIAERKEHQTDQVQHSTIHFDILPQIPRCMTLCKGQIESETLCNGCALMMPPAGMYFKSIREDGDLVEKNILKT